MIDEINVLFGIRVCVTLMLLAEIFNTKNVLLIKKKTKKTITESVPTCA